MVFIIRSIDFVIYISSTFHAFMIFFNNENICISFILNEKMLKCLFNGNLFKYCFVAAFKQNSNNPHGGLFEKRGLIVKNELRHGA